MDLGPYHAFTFFVHFVW